jgi:hypothetical protein
MKYRRLSAAILFLLCWRSAAQVVTPSNPVARIDQTVKFTADRPVTWSLAPGSAGSIDADGAYRAPGSIQVPKSLGGCQIGAPDSIFNTRVDNLPIHQRSAAWMAALPQQGISLDPSWGVNVIDNQTPSEKLVFNYTPTYNNMPFQIPAWPNLKRESGVFSDPRTDVDRHILAVNQQTCQVYEIYNNYPAGTLGSQPPASTYTAQSGWQYNSVSYSLPTDGATDAAGMPLAPTTLDLDDIRSGVIRHAMRVTFSNGYIFPSFLWPATTHAGAWGTVPYGTRFRLKAGFNISAFSATARIILTALKQYGMIISDGGANWDIVTATDLTEDRAVLAAMAEIANARGTLNAGQFEIVDESALMVNPFSSRVAYNNGYVTPSAYAIVIANDGVNPPVSVPIALQGTGLNAPEGGGIWIQSGVSKALSVFSGGAANPAVRWSMSPALGTLDPASGVYAAPGVAAPTSTSITAASLADPSVSVTFPLTILPAGPIRITAGDATGNPAAPNSHSPDYGPDSQGNMWWRDQAAERGWGVKNDYWYGAPWPAGTPDVYLYETQYYNTNDTVYRFAVPNGNYQIDYYVAQGDCPQGTWDPLVYREHLEAQGQIAAWDYRPLAAIGGRCYTPVHTAIPAQVTDNNLYFALRRITDRTKTTSTPPVTVLSAFSVTPSAAPPHLTIDPPVPPTLTLAQTVQLHAVGWYMSNNVTWSIESGLGSIDANGLYTAPAIPVNGTATIKATSTADPAQTATVQLQLSFGAIEITPEAIALNRGVRQILSASIGGRSYTNVAWSVSPGIGTIDTTGQYVAPDVLTQDTVVTVTATSKDDPTQSGSAIVTIPVNATPIRVNCGYFSPITDVHGNVWAADYGWVGETVNYEVTGPISRTGADMYALYDSSRYVYPGASFEYDFPLPNGTYLVTLKFADYTWTTPGHYDFDVGINGALLLKDFDPDSVYGAGQTAVDQTFVTQVASRNLRLTFSAHLGAAFINGIEILPINAFSRRVSGMAALSGRTQ